MPATEYILNAAVFIVHLVESVTTIGSAQVIVADVGNIAPAFGAPRFGWIPGYPIYSCNDSF